MRWLISIVLTGLFVLACTNREQSNAKTSAAPANNQLVSAEAPAPVTDVEPEGK